MNARKKLLIFALVFIPLYFIVGYVRNTVGICISWVEGVTWVDKFREYYIRPASAFANLFVTALLCFAVLGCAALCRRISGWVKRKG